MKDFDYSGVDKLARIHDLVFKKEFWNFTKSAPKTHRTSDKLKKVQFKVSTWHHT